MLQDGLRVASKSRESFLERLVSLFGTEALHRFLVWQCSSPGIEFLIFYNSMVLSVSVPGKTLREEDLLSKNVNLVEHVALENLPTRSDLNKKRMCFRLLCSYPQEVQPWNCALVHSLGRCPALPQVLVGLALFSDTTS